MDWKTRLSGFGEAARSALGALRAPARGARADGVASGVADSARRLEGAFAAGLTRAVRWEYAHAAVPGMAAAAACLAEAEGAGFELCGLDASGGAWDMFLRRPPGVETARVEHRLVGLDDPAALGELVARMGALGYAVAEWSGAEDWVAAFKRPLAGPNPAPEHLLERRVDAARALEAISERQAAGWEVAGLDVGPGPVDLAFVRPEGAERPRYAHVHRGARGLESALLVLRDMAERGHELAAVDAWGDDWSMVFRAPLVWLSGDPGEGAKVVPLRRP